MLHRHHIIPRHMDGPDTDDNIAMLTVEDHAKAHKFLWEWFGLPEDKMAWLALTGQIGKEEIQLERSRLGGLSRRGVSTGPKTAEHKQKLSAANLGKIQPINQRLQHSKAMQGNQHLLGHKHSEETRTKMSIAHSLRLRKPHSEETKAKMRNAALARHARKGV